MATRSLPFLEDNAIEQLCPQRLVGLEQEREVIASRVSQVLFAFGHRRGAHADGGRDRPASVAAALAQTPSGRRNAAVERQPGVARAGGIAGLTCGACRRGPWYRPVGQEILLMQVIFKVTSLVAYLSSTSALSSITQLLHFSFETAKPYSG